MTAYVLAWVEGRGGGHSGTNPISAKALAELSSIARGFLEEDRAKKRPSALSYMESLLADGTLYIDRRRPRKAVAPDDF